MVSNDKIKQKSIKLSLVIVSIFLITSQLENKLLYEVLKSMLKIVVVALGFSGIILFFYYHIELQRLKKIDEK